MSEWQPIETYDSLKKNPKFAIFYVKASVHERAYASLPEIISTSRHCGSRIISHWMPIPDAPKDEA